jgi:DNA-binding beta-propeller fold protein YncE
VRLTTLLLMANLPGVLAAGEPYVSTGFLKLPATVEVGAMSSVAIDAEDRIYVLHRGDPPLLAFDRDEKFLHGWGTGLFKVPHGLRVDKDGNVWTTDNGNHVLRQFSRDGRLLRTLGTEGVAGAGETMFRSPDDLVFNSKGEIYVADAGNKRIVHLAADGRYLGEWGGKGNAPGSFATAHGIGIDGDDRVYVADRGNDRVQIFDPAGKFVAARTNCGNPFGLLVVGDDLIVSDGDAHELFVLDREGDVTARWGTPETLLLPHLMAVNGKGTLYVTEVDGKRVQKFRKP